MTGFEVWARKELLEINRTWRRYVLPLLLLIMAVMSPVFAKITPDLLRSVTSNDAQVIIQVPDPTAGDALRQWGQSLDQIVLLGVIVIAAGLVSSDLGSGAGQLMLVKPLRRRDYILAKVAVLAIFLIILTVLATIICGAVTWAFFRDLPWREFSQITAIWLILAIMFICVMTLVSTVLHSQTAAAGAGIALYFASSLLALWQPMKSYTPIGLTTAYGQIAGGHSVAVIYPVITAVALAGVALLAAIAIFDRQTLR